MKVSTLVRRSAVACTTLLSCSLILSVATSSAEPLENQNQQATKQSNQSTELPTTVSNDDLERGTLGEVVASTVSEPVGATPPTSYLATAYSLKGRTASGRPVSKGMIAADPRILPLGSRVKLEAGDYSGEYLVADTGGAVRGRRIDIWTPSSKEAMRFGKRMIKLTVLSYGGKRKPTRSTAK